MWAADERAHRKRSFLAAYDPRLPHEPMREQSLAWRSAVAAYVEQLHPMSQPQLVAKELESSDEVLEQLKVEALLGDRSGDQRRRAPLCSLRIGPVSDAVHHSCDLTASARQERVRLVLPEVQQMRPVPVRTTQVGCKG